MSSIAILDYGGANELYARMQQLAQQGRLDFQRQASEMGGLVPQQQQIPQVRTSSARLGCPAEHFCHSCLEVHRAVPHPGDEPAQASSSPLQDGLQCTVRRGGTWAAKLLPQEDSHHCLCVLRRCSWTAVLFVLKVLQHHSMQHAQACCLLLQGPLQPQDIDWGDGAASLSNSSETRSLVEQQGALSASSASRHGGEAAGAAPAGMGGGQADARFAAGGMMGSMGAPQPAGGLQGLRLTLDCIPAEVCCWGACTIQALAVAAEGAPTSRGAGKCVATSPHMLLQPRMHWQGHG